MGAQAKTSTGIQKIEEMRVRRNGVYMSLETCELAMDFDGGRKDPPKAVKESTTVRGPVIAASY